MKDLILPLRGWRTPTPRKERRAKKKRSKGQRTKPSIRTREIDALIGDEEQKENRRKKEKETGCGTPTQLLWTSVVHLLKR